MTEGASTLLIVIPIESDPGYFDVMGIPLRGHDFRDDVSNIPQAIAPSADLAATGWNWRRVAGLWTWVVLACGIASVIGYGAASVVSKVHGARMAAFAAGGILAMPFRLAHSLRPRTLPSCRAVDRRRLLRVVCDGLSLPSHTSISSVANRSNACL